LVFISVERLIQGKLLQMSRAESNKQSGKESIAVVGGGMTGIAAALQLSQAGRFDV
jgi:heterodisulfide reductase subunit A-like polyferredoxin